MSNNTDFEESGGCEANEDFGAIQGNEDDDLLKILPDGTLDTNFSSSTSEDESSVFQTGVVEDSNRSDDILNRSLKDHNNTTDQDNNNFNAVKAVEYDENGVSLNFLPSPDFADSLPPIDQVFERKCIQCRPEKDFFTTDPNQRTCDVCRAREKTTAAVEGDGKGEEGQADAFSEASSCRMEAGDSMNMTRKRPCKWMTVVDERTENKPPRPEKPPRRLKPEKPRSSTTPEITTDTAQTHPSTLTVMVDEQPHEDDEGIVVDPDPLLLPESPPRRITRRELHEVPVQREAIRCTKCAREHHNFNYYFCDMCLPGVIANKKLKVSDKFTQMRLKY